MSTTVLTAMALQHDHLTTSEFVLAATQAKGVHEANTNASLYAWLLWMTHQLVGEIVSSGGLLSVFAGVGSVVAASRMLGPWAGLWVLAQVGVMEASTVPGPSILLVMSMLWASYGAAERNGFLCGILLAVALALADWVWPLALVVLWFSGRWLVCGSVIMVSLLTLYFLGCTIHFSMFEVASSSSTWNQIFSQVTTGWYFWVSVMALVWGGLRGNRASMFLAGMSIVLLLSLAQFQQPQGAELLLVVVMSLGVAAVETGPALLVLSMVLLGFRIPEVWDGTDESRGLESVIQATASNPKRALCTTSTYIRPSKEGGWIRPCVPVSELGRPPTDIRPVHIRSAAQQLGVGLFAVEEKSILHTYPWLQAFLDEPYPPGFEPVIESNAWTVFSVNP